MWEVKWEDVWGETYTDMWRGTGKGGDGNDRHKPRVLLPHEQLTCLKCGGEVGDALAVVRDGCHMDPVFLTTLEHGDLAAGGGWRTVKGRSGAVHSRGPVHVGSKHQIPSHCHHAAGAAVVHRYGRHWVYGWGETDNSKYFFISLTPKTWCHYRG